MRIRNLLPVVAAVTTVVALATPASATGDDDMYTIKEYAAPVQVGATGRVGVLLGDQTNGCLALGRCTAPTGTIHWQVRNPVGRIVQDQTAGPTSSGEESSSFGIDVPTERIGCYEVRGRYSGDDDYPAETITGLFVCADGLGTQTSATQSTSQGYQGDPVTFTADVAGATDWPIGGAAQVWYGVNPIGPPFPMTDGHGAVTLTNLPASDNTGRTYYVKYLGDDHYLASESGNLSHQTVARTATTTTLSAPAKVSHTAAAHVVVHTAAADGSHPAGAVTLTVATPTTGGAIVRHQEIDRVDANGVVDVTWPAGSVGGSSLSDTLKAAFQPDSPSYAPSSAATSIVFQPGPKQPGAKVALTLSQTVAHPADPITASMRVTVPSGAVSGVVAFTVDGHSVGLCHLPATSKATASCSVTFTATGVGRHLVNAKYGSSVWDTSPVQTTYLVLPVIP